MAPLLEPGQSLYLTHEPVASVWMLRELRPSGPAVLQGGPETTIMRYGLAVSRWTLAIRFLEDH